MKSRIRTLPRSRDAKALLAASALSVLVLAGCAAGPSPLPANAGVQAPAGNRSGTPSSPPDVSAGADGAPSAAAKMVCGDETRTNIIRILALPGAPRTSDSWVGKLYTCTYVLPAGSLILSVKETAGPAAARAHFDDLQQRQASATPIEGLTNLGLPAFETPSGSVVFVKDSFVLTVDATALPATLGPHDVSRNALAYETATAVLACWSE